MSDERKAKEALQERHELRCHELEEKAARRCHELEDKASRATHLLQVSGGTQLVGRGVDHTPETLRPAPETLRPTPETLRPAARA